MNITKGILTVKALSCLLLAAAAAMFSSCKKGSSASVAGISYQKLSETEVNFITGFALNGDPLLRDATRQPITYRMATKDFGHLGSFSGLAAAYVLSPRCEDAAGNYYGDVVNNGVWWLPAGATAWEQFSSPDTDTESAVSLSATPYPHANNKGELAMQTYRQKNGVNLIRIYRKTVTGNWVMASERPQDYYSITSLADNGDVFLQDVTHASGPMVLKPGSGTLAQLVDCAGVTILPYCQYYMVVNPNGDALLYQGGLGSRHMYSVKSAATYPATAVALYDLPDNTFSGFDGAYLADGTVVTRMNPGTYDPFFLYLRRAGAGAWQQSSLPNDDVDHSVNIIANLKGQVFTSNVPIGVLYGTGILYQVKY